MPTWLKIKASKANGNRKSVIYKFEIRSSGFGTLYKIIF